MGTATSITQEQAVEQITDLKTYFEEIWGPNFQSHLQKVFSVDDPARYLQSNATGMSGSGRRTP